MADERIDIEITDKVDGNIERKIIGIADASTKGYSAVQKLKAALKDVNTTAVSKLAAASNSATNALAREMNATAKLTIAKSREAEATARMAVSAQRLATEQAKTAAATLKAQAAADRAAAAKDKEANASRALQAELAREASAQSRVIHDRNAVTPGSGANLGGMAGSKSDAAAATNQMRRSSAPIIAPADVEVMNNGSAAADKLNKSLSGAGVGAGLARHQMVNLGYQLQDIVVSLQAGQNPLTVFIQQGSQIAGIAAASGIGFKAMAASVWALIAPFTLLIAVLAAAYLGFKKFTENSASSHKAELVEYANSLGLTSKEMRKLGNDSVDASGKLKSFNNVTITTGDSFKGFIATVQQGLAALFAPFEGVTNYFATAWSMVLQFVGAAFVGFYGLVMTLVKTAFALFRNAVTLVANTIALVVNTVAITIETVLNDAAAGFNFLINGYNMVQGALGMDKPIAAIGKFDLGVKSVTQGFHDLEKIDIGGTLQSEMESGLKGAQNFGKVWDANNLKIAKARLAADAAAIKANRNPKTNKPKKEPVDHTAENRAHALDVLNSKLDDELARMKLLKPEREIQQRMDQIENDLLQKKIKLNASEKASILGKVKAIEAYKFVQAESDRLYEAAVEPLRTYNATTQAATDLLKQGALSQDQFTQAVDAGARKYKEATDPLFAMNEAMDKNQVAAGLYGQAVEKNAFAEQVRQAFLEKNIDLSTNATAAQKAEAAAIIAKNNALLQQQFIQSQIGSIINPMLEQQQTIDAKAAMYAEIDRLEATSVLTHAQHEQAKYALDAKYSELRLQNASNTFSALAQLSSSGNSKLAAIGKAAAVAQATMDGYVAVQKALASGPPPWNYIQAAAVGVMTGVQVAGITNTSTNVGNFAQGGQFMVDGRAGVDNNNVNMNLSRGERVTIETAAQQRAADGEAGAERAVNLKVVNVTDPKDIEAALSDPENDHLFLNVLRRNPSQARQLTGGG
jgi:hypothetical protein